MDSVNSALKSVVPGGATSVEDIEAFVSAQTRRKKEEMREKNRFAPRAGRY